MSAPLRADARATFLLTGSLLLPVILLTGLIMRFSGLFGDLWWDEIWSLRLAADLHSVRDIFTSVHSPDNHYLHTLYLHLIGTDRESYLYRLPALLSGTAALALFTFLAWQRSNREALLMSVALSLSSLLIVQSTESRGYSMALLFAALSFWCARQRSRWFAIAAIAGILSHLSFLIVYAALILYTIAAGKTRRCTFFLSLYLAPVVVLVALYLTDFRHIDWTAIRSPQTPGLIYAALGLPPLAMPAIALAGLLLFVMASQIQRLAAGEPALAVFFASLLLLGGMCAAFDSRAAVICLPFALWLLSMQAARLPRTALVAVTILYAAGQIYSLQPFLRYGRGHYREAISYMRSHSAADIITISSDHDLIDRMVLDYYAGPFSGKPLLYLHSSHRGMLPEWLIFQHQAGNDVPLCWIRNKRVYCMARAFPASPLSGRSWVLYRSSDQQPVTKTLPVGPPWAKVVMVK